MGNPNDNSLEASATEQKPETLAPHGAIEVNKHDPSEDGKHCLVTLRKPGENGLTMTNEEADSFCKWWAANRTSSEYILKSITIA